MDFGCLFYVQNPIFYTIIIRDKHKSRKALPEQATQSNTHTTAPTAVTQLQQTKPNFV
jgi:hypothetical protein